MRSPGVFLLVLLGACAAEAREEVLPGADRLAAEQCARLRGRRLGLLTNRTGCLKDGRRTIDLLAEAEEVELVRIFTPEHGLSSAAEGAQAGGVDPATGIEIVSLYGESLRPAPEQLADLDQLVFDIQDVGVRFYTFSTTLLYALEACGAADLPLLVLDRPNPIAWLGPLGPVSDPEARSFICPVDAPLCHGLTLGEFARWQACERGILPLVEVLEVSGWDPLMRFKELGLPWIPPSPNLRDPEAAELYPFLGTLEATSLSVGRGTDLPFHVIGAPWFDVEQWRRRAPAPALPGITWEEVRFTPRSSRWEGMECGGLRFRLTDPTAYRPVEAALTLARSLALAFPESFDFAQVGQRLSQAALLERARAGPLAPADLQQGVAAYWQEVLPALLYPRRD